MLQVWHFPDILLYCGHLPEVLLIETDCSSKSNFPKFLYSKKIFKKIEKLLTFGKSYSCFFCFTNVVNCLV